MLKPFQAHRRSGLIVGAFTEGQADVLRFLLNGQLALLDEEDPLGEEPDPLVAALGIADGPVKKPDNPALARLFPDAYGDADEASEFRRLTEPDLREGKRATARQVLAVAPGLPARRQALPGRRPGPGLARRGQRRPAGPLGLAGDRGRRRQPVRPHRARRTTATR